MGLSDVTERGEADPGTGTGSDGVRGDSESSWPSGTGGEASLLRIAVMILDTMDPLLPGLPELLRGRGM